MIWASLAGSTALLWEGRLSYDMLTGRMARELVAAHTTADGRFHHGPSRSVFWTNIPEANILTIAAYIFEVHR
jgi:hypothetical protein